MYSYILWLFVCFSPQLG